MNDKTDDIVAGVSMVHKDCPDDRRIPLDSLDDCTQVVKPVSNIRLGPTPEKDREFAASRKSHHIPDATKLINSARRLSSGWWRQRIWW